MGRNTPPFSYRAMVFANGSSENVSRMLESFSTMRLATPQTMRAWSPVVAAERTCGPTSGSVQNT